MVEKSDSTRGAPRLAARAVAALVAAFWALLFFGIIDLYVVVDDDLRFYEHYLLETGWGLLFTFLVALPLLSWALRPQGWNGPALVAAALAILLAGLARPAPGQLLAAGGVAVSAAFPSMWRPRRRWSVRRLARPPYWLLDALVVVAVGRGLFYAWDMLTAARSGVPDDETNGLAHLPMQAGFGLAVGASAASALLALANRATGGWLAVVPAAVAAVWLGVVSRAYPDHLGSLGAGGGTLAIVWGVGLVVAGWGTRLLTHGRRQRDSS